MKKLVLSILNALEKGDWGANNSKLQSPGHFEPFPVFLNKVLLKKCSRLIYLWIVYGGFCPAAAHLHCAGPKGSIWLQSQKHLQSDGLQKSFANLDDCGICLKKKERKKERSKEIKTIESLALVDTGRQSWNFMLLPRHWSQGHAICHVVPSWCYCRGHLFGLIAVTPQTEFAKRKEKLPDSVSLR